MYVVNYLHYLLFSLAACSQVTHVLVLIPYDVTSACTYNLKDMKLVSALSNGPAPWLTHHIYAVCVAV